VNEEPVLRITTEPKKNSLSLRLEGQVEGPWVEVLRKTWTDATSRVDAQEIVVDFAGVSFVDPDGRNLLLTMQKQGVTLIKLSGFVREVLGRNGSNLNVDNSEE
jgi:hypothetical protein